jgi:hypothetical protein
MLGALVKVAEPANSSCFFTLVPPSCPRVSLLKLWACGKCSPVSPLSNPRNLYEVYLSSSGLQAEWRTRTEEVWVCSLSWGCSFCSGFAS